jgi:regulator of cell morphogenesis and NO signaling
MTRLNEAMSVAQIVLDHSECAPVFQKYRIDYCCKGEQPLSKACQQRGANPQQVLAELEQAVANRRAPQGIDPREIPTEALVQHIVKRHHRYLRDALPFVVQLSKKVARVHGEHNPKLIPLRDEVEALSDAMLPHMDQEEDVLFPALSSAKPANELVKKELATMHADHLEVSKLLEQIRSNADDFSLPDWACTSYTTLFRELKAVEEDLFTHVHLENHVLMPRFVSEAA